MFECPSHAWASHPAETTSDLVSHRCGLGRAAAAPDKLCVAPEMWTGLRPGRCVMRPVLVALVVMTVVGFVDLRSAHACSCAGSTTPCEAFGAEVVFVGEVESAEQVGSEFKMRLRVTRAFKGVKGPTVDIYSDAGTSCGVKLNPGQRYVIYTGRSDDGKMSIHAVQPDAPAGAR